MVIHLDTSAALRLVRDEAESPALRDHLRRGEQDRFVSSMVLGYDERPLAAPV
ncbi:MAG TPA: hypothetical protein VD813_09245 [Pseudonocardia sp.]|nr:hypothetical protein [Pseudonocardia sp.]